MRGKNIRRVSAFTALAAVNVAAAYFLPHLHHKSLQHRYTHFQITDAQKQGQKYTDDDGYDDGSLGTEAGKYSPGPFD